jgi:lipoate-protein ligase A
MMTEGRECHRLFCFGMPRGQSAINRKCSRMDYLDLTLPTPAENLAFDEVLLLEAEEGRAGEVLRFWESPGYAVVLGSSGRLQWDVRVAACEADGVPILRRCSGGGTVLLGPGCLLFSLVLSFQRSRLRDVTHSYADILNRVRQALATPRQTVERAGTSDLVVGDLKVSGNSQRRLRSHLLHHGTLLYDFDLQRMSLYLATPEKQPAYRCQRPHEAFVTNLHQQAAQIKDALRAAWSARGERNDGNQGRVHELVEQKYASPQWTKRR